MPYKTMNDVPENMKTMDKAALTIEQINAIAAQADAINKSGGDVNGWAVARGKFKEDNEIKNGAWVKKSEHTLIGYSFSRESFSLASAKAFVEEHGHDVPFGALKESDGVIYFSMAQIDPKDVIESEYSAGVKALYQKPVETFSIDNVEIFSAGTHTDSRGKSDTYTESDIKNMADGFNEMSADFSAPVKIGHDNNQKFLQADGLPAAGWLHNAREAGGKLIVDFKRVPKVIYELIKAGAFRKRSSEILHNFEIKGKKFKHFIGGVAMLGADLPALNSLSDIRKLYSADNDADVSIYEISSDCGGEEMDEKMKSLMEEVAALKAENATLKSENKKFKSDMAAMEKLGEQAQNRVAIDARRPPKMADALGLAHGQKIAPFSV